MVGVEVVAGNPDGPSVAETWTVPSAAAFRFVEGILAADLDVGFVANEERRPGGSRGTGTGGERGALSTLKFRGAIKR
jgi:hypothetical protein